MKINFTIDRFEEDKVILKANDGDTVIWPKAKIHNDLKEGSIVTFNITESQEEEKNKKEIAKEILNEILDAED